MMLSRFAVSRTLMRRLVMPPCSQTIRLLSESLPEEPLGPNLDQNSRKSNSARRVWKAVASSENTDSGEPKAAAANQQHSSKSSTDLWDYWEDPVLKSEDVLGSKTKKSNAAAIDELLQQISNQDNVSRGGRMRLSQLGVLRQDPSEDMRLLMENYTVPALASALRDREDVLQHCAELALRKQWDQLSKMLQPYQHEYVLQRRTEETLDLSNGFTPTNLEMLRKSLMRMPRRVTQAHQKRAGVVVALCNIDGIPSLLLEKRAAHLRAHPDEVCLPGGMVCSSSDPTIVATSLREMREEIGGLPNDSTVVLGVLRCNWGEVHHLVGVAVTPIVCYVGDISDSHLQPNPSEVSEVFTIPLSSLMDRSGWIHREGVAPIFTGGPHAIWGLTGYIVERFVKDILARYNVTWPE